MTFNVLINKYDFDNIYKMYASIYNALWIVFIELIIIIYAEKDYSGFLLVLMIIIMISAFTVRYMIQNATFFSDQDYVRALIASTQGMKRLSQKMLPRTESAYVGEIARSNIDDGTKEIKTILNYINQKRPEGSI